MSRIIRIDPNIGLTNLENRKSNLWCQIGQANRHLEKIKTEYKLTQKKLYNLRHKHYKHNLPEGIAEKMRISAGTYEFNLKDINEEIQEWEAAKENYEKELKKLWKEYNDTIYCY